MSSLLGFLFLFSFLILPWILTIFNIINLFKKKKIKEGLVDCLTFVLGITFSIILYRLLGLEVCQEFLYVQYI